MSSFSTNYNNFKGLNYPVVKKKAHDNSLFDVTDVESTISSDENYYDQRDGYVLEKEDSNDLKWLRNPKTNEFVTVIVKDLVLLAFTLFIVVVDGICAPNALLCSLLSLHFAVFFTSFGVENQFFYQLVLVSVFNGVTVSVLGCLNSVYKLSYIQILINSGFSDEDICALLGCTKSEVIFIILGNLILILFQIGVQVVTLFRSDVLIIRTGDGVFDYRITCGYRELKYDEEMIVGFNEACGSRYLDEFAPCYDDSEYETKNKARSVKGWLLKRVMGK